MKQRPALRTMADNNLETDTRTGESGQAQYRPLGRSNPSHAQQQPLFYPPPVQNQFATASKRRQVQPAGNQRDLIIRMLAEIFQVKMDAAGHMRWQQVSTSLVPISLYSRTTSKWLDYLLSVPPANPIEPNDPANAMSPDSRDFLLLLQQFHQQMRTSNLQQNQLATLEGNEAIVFQVVGHDFVQGQCRKILNVKLRQPGTRLGQASDYFVYWREQTTSSRSRQRLSHQQFSASSYASNASSCIQQQQQQSAPMKPNQTQNMLNPSNVTMHNPDRHPQQQFQTWGLNFASMNDAKLFFDICSLNVVNLDFNSEYLNQLPFVDGRSQLAGRMSPCSVATQMSQRRARQQAVRNAAILHQQQQQQQQARMMMKNRPTSRPPKRGIEMACSSCRQPKLVREDSKQCPVHGQPGSGQQRARSKSTTRQPSGDLSGGRARSLSMPASPESNQFMQRQTEADERELDRPEKPARGHLRSQDLIPGNGRHQPDNRPPPPARDSSDTRLLHSRPSSKTRYMGYLHQSQLEAPASQLRQEEAANRLLMMRMQRDHETLDSQRDARVARAQWAKSRDMKEFLSLDAGGQQQFQPAMELKRLGQQQRPKRAAKSTQETDGSRSCSTRPVTDTSAKAPPNSDGDQKQAGPNPVATSRIGVSGGMHNSAQCNAATTTDDLPMDSSTRRRMLRLTSDEIISERTEPKSISTIEPMQTNIETVELQRQQQSSRALSLGPDGDSNFRGRRARSDAGRRRSLERSGCVDLDSVLPASSFVKQIPRLSPLPQSLAASPHQQNEPQLEMPAADQKLYGMPGDSAAPQIHASLVDQIHNELASFKSVPDMSRIDFGRPEQFDWPMENECDDEPSRHLAHRSRGAQLNARPNLSSYAVPLCATVKRRPEAQHQVQRRQCHSCPNSLRRKRAPPPPPPLSGAQVHQLVDCCSCLHCQQMAFVSPMNLCACCRPADWPDCGQHPRRLIQKQHAGCQCQAAAGDEDQPRRHQTSRPQSSQSVRSPLQYGLYESDDEDEDDEDGGEFSSPAVRPVQGYDQTMLRACLKSRRRSKSQPPGGLDVDFEEEPARNEPSERNAGQHLTKSMENVEKLIREVQSELRQLTRQPLGAAQIDLKTSAGMGLESASGNTADQQKHHQPQQQQQQQLHYDAKMSLEEKEAEAKRKLQPDQARKWQLSYSSATRRAGQFKCVGAIRKAGFLSVKKWILKRRQSIELARKQGWKRYWVCLRGTALLFHSVIDHPDGDQQQHSDGSGQPKRIDLATWIKSNCSSQLKLMMAGGDDEKSRESFLSDMTKCFIEEEPRHLIIIDGAIAQPIPEHPKRDFVFCLSTTFGDAYLFQAGCQLESDNWIAAIHNACAASIARDLVRDEAIKLYEQKIRHFELDAEKKLFLRHRLESRLTSMSSMCKSTGPLDSSSKRPNSMRSLMFQLSQQLLALDTYIEQLHCEVYQLRCYLSSCSAQNLFYHNLASTGTIAAASLAARRYDLPHPKSLLMHVSKPTKVLLIKMGVFTVSSFHALIHARQDSARSILQSIEQHSSCPESPLLELRLKSRSISETLNLTAGTSPEERQLAAATENLIELANFKTIPIELSRELFNKITGQCEQLELPSDDRYSIQDFGHSLRLDWRLNSKLNSLAIIKQLLKMLRQEKGPELDYLNYYLRLVVQQQDGNSRPGGCEYYVVKQRETPEDWTHFVHLELLEKVVFRVELNRSQVEEDETTAPFGISVEGQLMSDSSESALNVFCSYVEWGSVADKAGLGEEDELLMINGIPVADLDLMFVECILQDSNRLRAVVRSSRLKCPPSSRRLDRTSWRSMDEDEDDGGKDGNSGGHQSRAEQERRAGTDGAFNSHQLMSDEYLTSLVCPPPPTKSSAVLRHEAANLLRRKSDLDLDQAQMDHEMNGEDLARVTKARSEHQMDIQDEMVPIDSSGATLRTSAELANLLVQKSERISRLLEVGDRTLDCHDSPAQRSLHDQNQVERLKKSIVELVETEYAYIRHLETINEHYMSPLSEMQFLNMFDLSSFNQSVTNLLRFQSSFFSLLINDIYKQLELTDQAKGQILSDDFERFNLIVQQVDSIDSVDEFEPILSSIAGTFTGEAAGFKIYAPYCVAYSRLQRVLHPKSAATNYLNMTTITSIPTAINIFASSSTGSNNSNDQHLRLVSLTGGVNSNGSDERGNQLRQLSEFLNNLDSSSSSVSFSLQQQNTSKQDHSKASSLTNSIELNSSAGNRATSRKSGQQQQQHHHQNFESYLIKPIQRIVKYPMLLNSIALAAETQLGAKNSTPIEAKLRPAIKQLEMVVNHVNESQRVHDEFGDVFDHIERQFFESQAREAPKSYSGSLFGPHQPPISLNIGQLLHTSPVEWLNMEAFSSKPIGKKVNLSSVLFVFESCVVFICKEQVKPSSKRLRLAPKSSELEQSSGIAARMLQWSTGSASNTNNTEQTSEIVRYQTLIPVSEVQVRSVSNEIEQERERTDAKFKWELFQCSSSNSNSSLLAKNSQCSGRARKQQMQHRNSNSGKVYLLASFSSEERNSFLRKIRLTIRESVRNMSLPVGTSNKSSFSNKSVANNNKKLSNSSTSSRTSNTNVNTSMSFSPADLITQDQSTTIKFEPYKTKQVHEIET